MYLDIITSKANNIGKKAKKLHQKKISWQVVFDWGLASFWGSGDPGTDFAIFFGRVKSVWQPFPRRFCRLGVLSDLTIARPLRNRCRINRGTNDSRKAGRSAYLFLEGVCRILVMSEPSSEQRMRRVIKEFSSLASRWHYNLKLLRSMQGSLHHPFARVSREEMLA